MNLENISKKWVYYTFTDGLGGGARGGEDGSGTALQAGGSQVRLPMVSLEFFIDIIIPVALWSRG